MENTFIIQKEHSGLTVKDYLRNICGFSARNIKSLKFYGKIQIDGRGVFTNFVLSEGMTLYVEFPSFCSDAIEAENISLDIIYEDDDYLAVNKCANMPVHPSIRHRSGTLANAVMYYYRHTPFVFRVLTRLDSETSGVVVIAKNPVAAEKFTKSKPKKEYLAVCVGIPNPKDGEITAPISRSDGIIKRCVDFSGVGKESHTIYKTLKSENGLSLLSVIPVTGRTHQIRLHLSYIGNPLYGDFLYGTEIPNTRTMLHCKKVTFTHPFNDKIITLVADEPKDFKEIL